jgi:hypothetical protein
MDLVKADHFSFKKSGAKELYLGYMACAAYHIIPFAFLFFRRFFSLLKRKSGTIALQ